MNSGTTCARSHGSAVTPTITGESFLSKEAEKMTAPGIYRKRSARGGEMRENPVTVADAVEDSVRRCCPTRQGECSSGHLSNLCGPTDVVIELFNAEREQE